MKLPYCEDDRMDFYKPHDKVVLPDHYLNSVKEQKAGMFHGYDVWLVDGNYIRDYIDVDFVEGGNPGRYLYVPEGEIWVEKSLTDEDYVATVMHEWYEAELMKHDGLSYSEAHDLAADMEESLRKDIEVGEKPE